MTEVGIAVDRVVEDPSRRTAERRGRWSWRTAGAAFAVYLVVSLVLWWGVWSTHPSTTTTCGCGDAARFIWFFKWPAYALTHGHSPFYSPLLFHPTGINLLNDTSVLALGVVLAPVTWVAGPVAAMNVALTLAPVLSAWAMFVLLRRWVVWEPAAFIGGLVYGFSPFLITELALNQLNIAFLAIPPLVVLALDELLVRQRRSPYRTGVALAALLVVEFFVSTEVLVITCLFAVVAVVLMAGFVSLRQPGEIGPRTGHALRGSATAVGVAAVVLAYPLWFLLRGPAHLTGPIWSNGALVQFGNTFTSFWRTGGLEQIQSVALRFGGYQGPTLPVLGYLGPGVIAVAVVGVLVWRHDRRLLLFGALGVVAAVLSLGPGHGYWVPWQLVEKLPWVGDIVEVRFSVVLILCSGILVAVAVDRFRTWLQSRAAQLPLGPGWVAAALAVVMLIPTAVALWPNIPLTTRAVDSRLVRRGRSDTAPGPGPPLVPGAVLGSAELPGLAGAHACATRRPVGVGRKVNPGGPVARRPGASTCALSRLRSPWASRRGRLRRIWPPSAMRSPPGASPRSWSRIRPSCRSMSRGVARPMRWVC